MRIQRSGARLAHTSLLTLGKINYSNYAALLYAWWVFCIVEQLVIVTNYKLTMAVALFLTYKSCDPLIYIPSTCDLSITIYLQPGQVHRQEQNKPHD